MKSSKRAAKLKYWQETNQAYEVSDLTIKAFCSSQNIDYKHFLNYRYRIKQIQARHQDTSSLFIPVAIKAAAAEEASNKMMINSSPKDFLVLQLNNRTQLQIPIEAVSSHLLRIVFSALEVL